MHRTQLIKEDVIYSPAWGQVDFKLPYMRDYVDQVHQGMAFFEEAMRRYVDRLVTFPSHGNFLLLRFVSRDERNALIRFLAQHDIFVRETSQSPSVQDCFRITCGTVPQMRRVAAVIDEYYAGK